MNSVSKITSQIKNQLQKLFWLLLMLLVLQGSVLVQVEPAQVVRQYTRPIEFDFTSWTVNASLVRWSQVSTGASSLLDEKTRTEVVREYFYLTYSINQVNAAIDLIFTDPAIPDPEVQARDYIQQRESMSEARDAIQALAESILAEQVGAAISEAGIGILGAAVPPVAFHLTQTPYALIVSPRDVIRQDANIQLDASLTLEERVSLENQVEQDLDVSALVVATGGIGIYPTMVLESTSLSWILEVIAHEWTHNYLSLHPLGLQYGTSAELRTMNETVANLIGKEISHRVLAAFYPDLLPPEVDAAADIPLLYEIQEPVFDFNAEMRETRINVDSLLAQGKVKEAETYMEERRAFFWDNGYAIRKLNQAYFAFHGAYADQAGGGAAGEDPVGAAVRALWQQLNDPAAFLKEMAWMDSVTDLERALAEQP
ncbi:MAG: hypothetical protein JXA25_01950 [Anaerolineales bacterium]|nr:hypothetical protein [Anaerolineales bacterium]